MDVSDVSPEDIRETKKIGQIGSDPVYQLDTIGGITLIMVKNEEERKGEFIGAGTHPAMARFAARRRRPELQLTDLQKSYQDPSIFEPYLPYFDSFVDSLNKKL